MNHHKRVFTWILLVVFVLPSVMVFAPVSAQEGVVVEPAGEAVTVRSGPGVEYSIRGTLYPGFSLVATGRTAFGDDFVCTGDPEHDKVAWLRVDIVEGIEGWVSYCALAITGDPLALEVAEPAYPILLEDLEGLPDLDAGEWEPSDPFFGCLLVTPVLLYEYPSLGSTILGKIEAGEMVELLGRSSDGSWYQVRYGEYVGWIPSYLLIVSAEQDAALPVIDLEDFFDDLIDEEVGEDGAGCENPPPPWAPAWGWRRKCEGLGKGEYVPEPPPGHAKKDTGEDDGTE